MTSDRIDVGRFDKLLKDLDVGALERQAVRRLLTQEGDIPPADRPLIGTALKAVFAAVQRDQRAEREKPVTLRDGALRVGRDR